MPPPAPVAAVEGLFTEGTDGPRLLGSVCRSCGTYAFPRREMCSNVDCPSPDVIEAEFGAAGEVWTFAVQNYPPPSPALSSEPHQAYAVGLVDLPSVNLRVVTRFAGDVDDIEIGLPVELVIGPIGKDEGGTEIVSWMYRPVSRSPSVDGSR